MIDLDAAGKVLRRIFSTTGYSCTYTHMYACMYHFIVAVVRSFTHIAPVYPTTVYKWGASVLEKQPTQFYIYILMGTWGSKHPVLRNR